MTTTVVSKISGIKADISSPVVTMSDGATITPNFELGSNFIVALGGNRTLGVPIGVKEGQSGVISIWQDATGTRTLSFDWGYVFAGGASPSLSTAKYYNDHLYYLVTSYKTSPISMTIATPSVVTWNSHGLVSGQRIRLTTTGTLPTGVSSATTYWVKVTGANTFNIATSLANLQSETLIATSGSQSGEHAGTNMQIVLSLNPAIR